MTTDGRALTRAQKVVLAAAFVPMVATGVAGGYGTYGNIKGAYGSGTALGAVAAGEGATAVLALVLLGLTMLGQSSPLVIRAGLWAQPAAAAVMSAMAADDPGRTVIYALTPMGMTTAAEGAAFLARRIVVHRDGRDAEAEQRAAAVIQALAYHRARAAHHPDEKVRRVSERTSWKLARKVGLGDVALGARLVDVQRDRVTEGANAALVEMFDTSAAALPSGSIRQPSRSIDPMNAEESTQTSMERSTSDVDKADSTPLPTLVELEVVDRGDTVDSTADVESTGRVAVHALAVDTAPRRRATGRVPDAARSSRPRRTPDELLAEARQLTESWSVEQLTAEAIRKAVRTSPEKARRLRETLRAERAQNTPSVV